MKRIVGVVAAAIVIAAVGWDAGQGGGAGRVAGRHAQGARVPEHRADDSHGPIQDVAIDPKNPSIWHIASAFGGVWKTVNRGITFEPIFEHYGSFTLCCIVIDPKDSNVLWLGTGENASQRSATSATASTGPRTRADMDARRPRDVRAHRPHRHRSAQFERRLGRRPGAAVL
jgi:hypothetical protein